MPKEPSPLSLEHRDTTPARLSGVVPHEEDRIPESLLLLCRDVGLRLPHQWERLCLQAGPVSVEIWVADCWSRQAVLRELSPPWPVGRLGADKPQFTVFTFPTDTLSAMRALGGTCMTMSSGDRPMTMSCSGDVRIARFDDSGSLLIFDRKTCVGVLGLGGEHAELDAREVIHRQLVQRALEAKGFVLLHAAGVSLNGDVGVILVGESGAGKTTLQLDIAAMLGARLMGGGRVYCDEEQRVLPYPGQFKIGVGLASNRSLLQPLLALRPPETAKLHVPSGEIAHLLGTRLVGEAKLQLIVYPELYNGIHLQSSPPLADSEKLALLLQHCITPRDPIWPNWLGAVAEPERKSVRACLEGLARKVTAIKVKVPRRQAHLSVDELTVLLAPWVGASHS